MQRSVYVSHAITIRLDSPLSEQLRETSYRLRVKKQPIMRGAISKLILEYEGGSPKKQRQILKRLSHAALMKAAPPCTQEKILLDTEISDLLRWFAFESRQTYQAIVSMALRDYIDDLDRARK